MHYHVYCDESSNDKGNEYMALGGVLLPATLAASLKTSIGEWRQRRNMRAEIKWTKIHRKKFSEYDEFVRGSMLYVNKKKIAFRSMILKNEDLDPKGFHGGDGETGYFKFIYELLFYAHCRLLEPGDTLSIFIDERKGSCDALELKDVLNTALCCNRGFSGSPVRHVAEIDSKSSEFLQMNDVLLGAVGHDCNRRSETPGCRPEKMAMAKLVATLAGLPHLRMNTDKSMTHFGVWRFKLQPKKEKRPSP